MSLTKSITNSNEKLVFASGNTIYVYDYGRPQPISRRSKYIKSLTVHNGKLLDSGNYRGIYDTAQDELVFGPFNRLQKRR